MSGCWDAYEEATDHDSDELKEMDRQVLQLQSQLCKLLTTEHQGLFDQYETAINSRLALELERAYLSGYQTAIRFLLLGLLPMPSITENSDCNHDVDQDS